MNTQSVRTAILSALLAVPLAAGAYTFTKPFSYYANGNPLPKVLTSFAKNEGLAAEISPRVKGHLSGRFKNIDAKTFLQALKEAYDVNYYVLGETIHFYHTKEVKKTFLTVRTGNAKTLIDSLKKSGYVAEELPLRINVQGNMVTVLGPEDYLEQVTAAASAYEAVNSEKITMRVFPLKHAWAEDLSVTSMDSTVTVPGVASVLRAMVMGQSSGGQTVTQKRKSAERLGAQGVSATKVDRATNTTTTNPVSNDTDSGPVLKGSISIMADPRMNAVLVSDVAYRMPYYEQVISELDRPVELVEIHAAIVDIDTNAQRDLGINLAGTRSSGDWKGGGTGGAARPEDSREPTTVLGTAGAILSTVYQHGSDFFMARISAMEQNNEARVLGRPSVLTTDNVQATLENTTTYYVKLEGKEAVDLFKVEAGTVLKVTPHIIHENGKTSIRMAVNVQDDQDNSTSAGLQDGNVPPIKQTKINTQAVIDVGQSLLVGGYYYEQREEGETGVPLLKDIPILGHLFKTKSKKSKRMERLILITPRIVRPSGTNIPSYIEEETKDLKKNPTEPSYELKIPSAKVQAVPAASEAH